MSLLDVLKDYKKGLGFRENDILTPRQGSIPHTYNVRDNQVIVLSQCVLAPHQYTVLGERIGYRAPEDRFVRFDINGHQWEKI
jgi:hypothetical protein